MTDYGELRLQDEWSGRDTLNGHHTPSRMDWSKIPIIAVTINGDWARFSCIGKIVKCIGIHQASVSRCCRLNHEQHVNRKTGKVNTDHQYHGIRFYYESDAEIWQTKINTSCEASVFTKWNKKHSTD